MRELIKKLIPHKLFRAIEPYGHMVEAMLANLWYGFPARSLKVIGVTGTDGKTTTSTMIMTMLRHSGYKVGMMTTVSLDLGDGPIPNPTRLTTVTAFDLQRGLKQLKKAGVEWVVLETTSHALAQNRVWGVPYSVAVLTNVTSEHLDYHGTVEKYRAAKVRLFELAAANENGLQTGVVNADSPFAAEFIKPSKQVVTYGEQAGDVRATKIKSSTEGSHFTVESKAGSFNVEVHIPGSFNVYNALAAVSVGQVLGLKNEQIATGIASLDSVEGRMTTIDEGQPFSVIVDYAHTPDSFEKVFAEMRPVTKGQLIVLFGSAGRRDEGKRAKQGKIAGEKCDYVVVTEEDDRDVDGEEIMNQIAGGAEAAGKIRGKDLFLIHDRPRAIAKAMELAGPGDTVLLLGKGHEKSILGNYGKRDYDEVTEARKALTKLR